ncbi:MAG: DNA polymerase III subunit gamma/tau [Commensalibacter sp.]|nr:DNA polymerase III subunit gamma/tau [Commensalibacter sp.]
MDDIPDDNLPQLETESANLFGELPQVVPQAQQSYRVLARKYRPQTFDDLIGQEAMVRTLRNAFAMGRVAHAFMLTGVRGVGKTTTARIIARALNCVGVDGKGGPTADPCGVCPNCKAILADRHPDVLEIDAASHTGVDDVREIIEGARFRPIQARMKVYIIDEVHMLSRNAFNALLKTLEEPPEQVTFIFATTELRKVPVTVLSRCQRFDLRRVSQEQLAEHFTKIAEKEKVAIDPQAINLIARAADGSVRDGLSLLDQAIARGGEDHEPISAATVSEMLGFADRALVFDLFEALMAGKPDRVLELTAQAHANGADLGVLLTDLLDLVHLITRIQTIPSLRKSGELSELERIRGVQFADLLSVPVLGRAWQMLLKGIGEVEIAPNRRAAAEMILIRLCYVADLPSPGDLVKSLTQNGSGSNQGIGRNIPSGSGKPSTATNNFSDGGRLYAVGQSELAPTNPPVQPQVQNFAEQWQQPEALSEKQQFEWQSWREILAFVKKKEERLLHAHMRNSVHLVRFAPPVIEIRIEDNVSGKLASQLSKLLNENSTARWTIVLSQQAGEPTLMEQEQEQAAEDLEAVKKEPFVQQILQMFPGATLARVTNHQLDEYGLSPEVFPEIDEEEPFLEYSEDDEETSFQ